MPAIRECPLAANQLSSGDVIADRRADYAKMMAEGGDFGAAAELMEQALELAPGWAAGWFRLGEFAEKAGASETAAKAYRQVAALDAEGMFGAALKLALLGESTVPEQPPSRYVEQLFDDYAHRFDKALTERLQYSVPQKLAALVRSTGRRFETAVDLGCGTGLFGAEIRALVNRLEGYDLSRNMLREAAEKQVYDHLEQADLAVTPAQSGLFAEGLLPNRADLVSAADVLMYLGDLAPFFRNAAHLAAPNSVLAFSVEEGEETVPYALQPSLRYAHGKEFVEALLAEHGFVCQASEHLTIRMDGGRPVPGILFLAIGKG